MTPSISRARYCIIMIQSVSIRSYRTRPTVLSGIIQCHLTVCYYEFLVQNSDLGGAVPGQSVLRAFGDVRSGNSMRAVSIWISAFTSRTRPTEPCELDMPRLATSRGPARGRARANLRSLHAQHSSTIATRAERRRARARSRERGTRRHYR